MMVGMTMTMMMTKIIATAITNVVDRMIFMTAALLMLMLSDRAVLLLPRRRSFGPKDP